MAHGRLRSAHHAGWRGRHGHEGSSDRRRQTRSPGTAERCCPAPIRHPADLPDRRRRADRGGGVPVRSARTCAPTTRTRITYRPTLAPVVGLAHSMATGCDHCRNSRTALPLSASLRPGEGPVSTVTICRPVFTTCAGSFQGRSRRPSPRPAPSAANVAVVRSGGCGPRVGEQQLVQGCPGLDGMQAGPWEK